MAENSENRGSDQGAARDVRNGDPRELSYEFVLREEQDGFQALEAAIEQLTG